jgi:NAD(P)-dependent dehydrogenase (short-subunit alcohol dehydrogenase family)
MTRWTASDIPPQKGRSAVVTGTRGLGFETARALTRAGGEVILAGRNLQKGAEAVANIRAEIPSANIRFEEVDLASLKSVAAFAARLRHQREDLDLLINNAGVMRPPKRLVTEDGFELQFGTNYLGHFSLTAHLLPLLRNGKDARVITLSSIAARGGAKPMAGV